MDDALRFASPVETHLGRTPEVNDHTSSGVSWAAVIGGAFVAASISLIMLALGAGFGLSVVSPWSNVGATAKELGTVAIIWLVVTQVLSCALGGYLAGRLRTKWVSVHTDEVYFRDTANGFLVWSVGLVMTVTLLVSAGAAMAGKSSAETSKAGADPRAYYVDRLFRSDGPAVALDASALSEASLIFANTMQAGDSSQVDQTYLGHLVAVKTGISQADADRRVSQVLSDARAAEDIARKTASRLLLWLFVALLMGAFSASLAATIGGRNRDHVSPS